MKNVTLSDYQHSRAVSWARPDCDHQPGMWRRDVTVAGLHNLCISECKLCGKTLHAEWTAYGKIIRILETA